MNFHWRKILLGTLLFIGAFAGLIQYSLSQTPKINKDSKLVLDKFMAHSQKRDYKAAYQLFTPNLQSTFSLPLFSQDWQKFEKAHGPIAKWKYSRGMVSMGYPRFVESVYEVTGNKNGAGIVRVQLVPYNKTWRVDRLLIYP